MEVKLTKQQETAVKAEGTVLVAAAAGSGKTAVLVERIMRRFTNEEAPLMADRALIVTFTNAAAEELKTKIEDKLRDELEKNPHSALLNKQNLLIKNAAICTIDSFCIGLVRDNFHFLNIARDFKIADPSMVEITQNDILNRLFTEKYADEDDNFLKLLRSTQAGYDDRLLRQIVLTVYNKGCSMPYQEKWYDEICELCSGSGENYGKWSDEFFKEILLYVNKTEKSYNKLLNSLKADEGETSNNISAAKEAIKFLNELRDSCIKKDSDWIYDNCGSEPEGTLRKNAKLKPETAKALDTARKLLSDLKALIGDMFPYNKETARLISNEFYEVVCGVISLVKEYSERVFAESMARNTFTFDQIEHMALKLLNSSEGKVCAAFCSSFDAILVDEYQDTSNLQDELFKRLNDGLGSLFTVGDVKQSIYGFRNANPDNFLIKKDNYLPYEDGVDPSKVLLTGNFRSRAEICRFVNYIFAAFMTKESADMDYNDDEALVPMASFPNNEDETVELRYIDAENEESTEQAEARAVAEAVVEIINKPPFLTDDNGGLRKAEYGDIVLLMRSPKNRILTYVDELKKRGIPVNSPATKFCESPEITAAIAMLKAINNTNDSIALLTLIKSPVFSFNDDEIANIMLINRRNNLYLNLIEAAKQNAKAAKTVDFIRYGQKLSVTLPLNELLRRLFLETSFSDIFTAVNSGLCRDNLNLLSELAAGYGLESGKTIKDFTDYIESDSNSSVSASSVNSGNAVRIMSFHTSKGLQFPVCFICGLGNRFNLTDTTSSVICDDSHGLSFNYFSNTFSSIITPVNKKYIASRIKQKLYKEELRLLYVALTRAKEKLVLFITNKNIEGYISDMTVKKNAVYSGSFPFSGTALRQGNCFADWITVAALCHSSTGELFKQKNGSYIDGDCDFNVRICAPHEAEICDDAAGRTNHPNYTVITEYDYKYPFDYLRDIPAKTSVTDILNGEKPIDNAFSARPAFMSRLGLTPAERGTAAHKFMEYCDFGAAVINIEKEIERLYEWEYISREEAAAIDRTQISAFFESYAYFAVKKAIKVYREYRFLTRINAHEFNGNISADLNEYSLVQGVADCVIENEKDIYIIDYKTDLINSETKFREEYKKQLSLYSEALCAIFKKPVTKKIIYSFHLKRCIEV